MTAVLFVLLNLCSSSLPIQVRPGIAEKFIIGRTFEEVDALLGEEATVLLGSGALSNPRVVKVYPGKAVVRQDPVTGFVMGYSIKK